MTIRIGRSLLGGVIALGALAFAGASPAWSDHFKPLSPNHTSYGVAQLNYGEICCSRFESPTQPAVRLMNPNHVTQVAALIVYESARGNRGGTPELYVGCTLRVLTPNGSLAISDRDVPENGRLRAKYGEVIWAPVDEVSPGRGEGQTTRIADGLGGYFSNAFSTRMESVVQLAHPGLFSLPSDAVVDGQRQAAIDCVLDGLAGLGLPSDIFSDFGIE